MTHPYLLHDARAQSLSRDLTGMLAHDQRLQPFELQDREWSQGWTEHSPVFPIAYEFLLQMLSYCAVKGMWCVTGSCQMLCRIGEGTWC